MERSRAVKVKVGRWLMLVAAIAGVIAMQSGPPAEASHGRYFNLSWRVSGPDSADFRLTAGFRRCTYNGTDTDGCPKVGDVFVEGGGGTDLNYGDGRSSGVLRLRVIAINKTDDWLLGEALE